MLVQLPELRGTRGDGGQGGEKPRGVGEVREAGYVEEEGGEGLEEGDGGDHRRGDVEGVGCCEEGKGKVHGCGVDGVAWEDVSRERLVGEGEGGSTCCGRAS